MRRGTVFKIAKDGTGFTVLHSFGCTSTNGCFPHAGVTEGSDGSLYGTTQQGGAAGNGTVFRISKDGTGFTVLHSFGCGSMDGCLPDAAVTEGSDGALYGTTAQGGTASHGTIFRISKEGTGFTVLHSFGCTSTHGCSPSAAVTEGGDGALYGTTSLGGAAGSGTVFKIAKDGTGFTVLHSFGCTSTNGCFPSAGVTEGSDGSLYGTTPAGGAASGGTVFRINKNGTGFMVVHSFDCARRTAVPPRPRWWRGGTGRSTGRHRGGGRQMGERSWPAKNGTGLTVLHPFGCTGLRGCFPVAGLTEGSDGALYGTTPEWRGGESRHRLQDRQGWDGVRGPALVRVHEHARLSTQGRGDGGERWGAIRRRRSRGGAASGGTIFRINTDGTGFTVLHSFEARFSVSRGWRDRGAATGRSMGRRGVAGRRVEARSSGSTRTGPGSRSCTHLIARHKRLWRRGRRDRGQRRSPLWDDAVWRGGGWRHGLPDQEGRDGIHGPALVRVPETAGCRLGRG